MLTMCLDLMASLVNTIRGWNHKMVSLGLKSDGRAQLCSK